MLVSVCSWKCILLTPKSFHSRLWSSKGWPCQCPCQIWQTFITPAEKQDPQRHLVWEKLSSVCELNAHYNNVPSLPKMVTITSHAFVNWINTLICKVPPYISSTSGPCGTNSDTLRMAVALRSRGENVPTRMVDETLAILSSLPRRLDAVVPGVTHELPLLPPNWKNTVTP